MTDLAVVSDSGKVIGRFVVHDGNPIPKNRNNLKVMIVSGENILETHKAYLSLAKGNIDELNKICNEANDLHCMINSSEFDADLVLLK